MRLVLLALTAALALLPSQERTDPKKQPKADVGDGRIAWFDITTRDMAKSRAFYAALFGWTFTSLGTEYAVEIVAQDTPIGTLRVAEGPISAYDGVVYVQVPDMPAACAKARELGGSIPPGFPFDLSDDGGAVALVIDPAGHPVGMYCRTPLAAALPAGK